MKSKTAQSKPLTPGARIKQLRVSQGRQAIWLAEQVGISKQSLWNRENDRAQCDVDFCYRVAEALQVKPGDIDPRLPK